jgi:hypothetical protein
MIQNVRPGEVADAVRRKLASKGVPMSPASTNLAYFAVLHMSVQLKGKGRAVAIVSTQANREIFRWWKGGEVGSEDEMYAAAAAVL